MINSHKICSTCKWYIWLLFRHICVSIGIYFIMKGLMDGLCEWNVNVSCIMGILMYGKQVLWCYVKDYGDENLCFDMQIFNVNESCFVGVI